MIRGFPVLQFEQQKQADGIFQPGFLTVTSQALHAPFTVII